MERPQQMLMKVPLWVPGRTEEEARAKAAVRFKVAESQVKLQQDPDVPDTWSSSRRASP